MLRIKKSLYLLIKLIFKKIFTFMHLFCRAEDKKNTFINSHYFQIAQIYFDIVYLEVLNF